MTSRRPYWCSKTMKRRPCWCSKTILWELNSFLIQTPSLVPMNLHRCWPCEWKRSIGSYFNHNYMQIHVTDVISQYVASSQTLYFLFKVRRARVIKYKPQGIHWHKTTSMHRLPNSPLKERKTKRGLVPKCVPQLFVGSFLVTYQSAIGQFFSLSLVTVPKVFAKVNSVQSPVSEVENSHNILTFCLTLTLPHRTLLTDLDVVKILNP